MWGRGQRGNNAACSALHWLLVTSPTTHQHIGPFWCWFLGRRICVHPWTPWAPPTNFPVRLGVSPATRFLQPGVLRLSFPVLEPWVAWSVWLLHCSSRFIFTHMCDHQPPPRPPSPPAATLPHVLSAPPISLHECFFFNSLVVGHPHSSICWQLWSFFVFKYFVVLLLVVGGGKVDLPTPPSWTEVSNFILFFLLLRYNWHIPLYQFQVYDIMMRCFYILQNEHHGKSS